MCPRVGVSVSYGEWGVSMFPLVDMYGIMWGGYMCAPVKVERVESDTRI